MRAGSTCGAASGTQSGYRHDVDLWDRYVTEYRLPWWPNEVTLAGWVRTMTEQGLATTTIARRVAALRSLCKYAARVEAIERNEVADFEAPRARRDEKRLVRLSTEQVRAVIATADQDPRPWCSPVVRLMAVHGMRVNEVIDLHRSDVTDIDGHRVIVFDRKGGKQAVTPLPATTLRALAPYLDQDDGEGPPLPVSYPQIRRLLTRLGRAAGVERLHAHALRAAFVTEALRAGVELDRVQYAASHSDPRTTQGYDRRALDLDGHPAHVVGALVDSAPLSR